MSRQELKDKKNISDVIIISVSNNNELYDRFFKKNSFVNFDHLKKNCFDNIDNKSTIPQWYNKFLNEYDYTVDSWFIFCHCDWELMEDIRPILADLDKKCLYGPIGSKIELYNNKVIPSLEHVGSIWEQKRDGSSLREVGNKVTTKTLVDTFDCQAIIVHCSLVNEYELRFDENLNWDLYVEDFCISANKNFDIKSYVIPIKCCHHSDAGFQEPPISYYKSLDYINKKYPNDLFAGTCSYIGGRDYEICTAKERIFAQIRRKKNFNSDVIMNKEKEKK